VPISVNRIENGDSPGEFEDIDIAEEELIDAYVRDELSVDERKLLENGLRTSPHLVNRLHFARLLASAADHAGEVDALSAQKTEEYLPPRQKWWWFWEQGTAINLAFAACSLILVIGGGGLLAGWISLRHQSRQLAEQQAAVERERLELQKSAAEQQSTINQITAQLREEQQQHEANQQLIAELQQAQSQKPTAAAGMIATFFLAPISRGSEKEKELKPPAGTSRIRLQLGVDSIDYRGFLVKVNNSQDKEIFQQKLRPPRSGKLVTIMISSKVLPPGTYSLQLSGISPEGTSEPVGNYSFRIADHKSQ
jgi:hypothetical protein